MNWVTMYSRYDQSVTKVLFLLFLSAQGLETAQAAYSAEAFSRVITPQEKKIDSYREQEIQQLQIVLSRSASREQQPDLLLRLAELYTEKYRLFYYKENEIWQQQIDAYLRQPIAAQKQSKRPVLDNGASKAWLNKAVTALEKIPSLKQRYSRLDEVYYFLGFNYWEMGRKKDSVQFFARIIREFPKSKFSPEAHRYLADYSFANRDFDTAKKYYTDATKFENNLARPRILYGLAWSEFKLRNYSRAVQTMRQAIIDARTVVGAEKMGLGLQRDAYDSLALFYSEGGDTQKAAEFFTALVGNTEASDLLRKLAMNYQRQGKYAKALAVNKQLIDLSGSGGSQAGDEQRYAIMLDSLRVSQTKGDREKEAALLKGLVVEFIQGKQPSEELYEEIRGMLRKAALSAHQEGSKAKNSKAVYSRAEALDRLYLSAFGSRQKPEEVAYFRYLLADAVSQQEKHREAAAEFRSIVEASLAPGGEAFKKYQKDSALGIIFSLDAYFKASGTSTKAEVANEVIEAIDSYARIFPNDKELPKFQARAAGLLVTGNRFEEARPRLQTLIEQYSTTKEALDAAVLLIKDSEQRKDYAAAASLAESLLANRGLMGQDKEGKMRAQLQSIASRAKFQQVQNLEQGQNFAEAAQRYEQLATEAKDSEVRFKALNNAAVSYAKASDQVNELRIYQKILSLYPENEQAAKNILAIGNKNFLAGNYQEAAKMFEMYYASQAARLPKLKADQQSLAISAVRSAALLQSALGIRDKAGEDFKAIVDAANKGIPAARTAAEEFLYETATRLNDQGNAPEAIRAYQRLLSAFPQGKYAIEASMESALLYAKLQEPEKAQNFVNATLNKLKQKGGKTSAEELNHAAHARLILLSGLEEAYQKSPLRLPEEQLKKDIKEKLAAMERLNKGYLEVIEFGDGTWGVESFRRMAMAYRDLAQKLDNAPVPPEFSPEDKAKFKAQLKNLTAPIYLKVIETLETALKKGEELTVVGPVMAKIYVMTVLEAARPDRYPLIQEISWSNPRDWISGDIPLNEGDLAVKRQILQNKPEDAPAWVSIGNFHLLRGEEELAKIFYLRALDKNPKNIGAINNLAYLEGKAGRLARAVAGFKTCLAQDEFAILPKKNIARLYMASGLWRHANLAYRQLEVRNPSDQEIKRGLALSYLATGKLAQAEPFASLLTQGGGKNARYAAAALALARGDQAKARSEISSIAGGDEIAALIQSALDKEK